MYKPARYATGDDRPGQIVNPVQSNDKTLGDYIERKKDVDPRKKSFGMWWIITGSNMFPEMSPEAARIIWEEAQKNV